MACVALGGLRFLISVLSGRTLSVPLMEGCIWEKHVCERSGGSATGGRNRKETQIAYTKSRSMDTSFLRTDQAKQSKTLYPVSFSIRSRLVQAEQQAFCFSSSSQ